MDNSLDILKTASEYIGQHSTEIRFLNIIDLLNDRISKTIALIDKLNKSLALSNSTIYQLTSSHSIVHNSVRTYETAQTEYSENEQTGERVIEKKEEPKNDKSTDHVEELSKVLESSVTIFKALEKLHIIPTVLGKVIKPLELASSVASIVSGVKKVAGLGEEGGSAMERIGGAAEAVVGIATVVEVAELLSGPLGWAVLGGTLLTEAVIANYDQQEEIKKRNERNELSSKKAISTFAMSAAAADKYIGPMDSPSKKSKGHARTKHMSVFTVGDDNRKLFGTDAYKINFTVPTAARDNIGINNNLPPDILKHNEDKMPIAPKSFLEQTSRLRRNLWSIGMSDGKTAFDSASAKAQETARMNDRIHGTNTALMTTATIREVRAAMVAAARQDPDNKLSIHKVHRRGSTRHAKETYNKSGCKTIIINLNRPMIEHFTVNTCDGAEGITEFKSKVEEVLIKILNSANTIQ